MEFKFNAASTAGLQKEGKGVDTGIYKAKITMAAVSKSTNGNNMLDLYFETEAKAKFAIYGICIDEKWVSGAENFDFPTFMELANICGMKTGEQFDTTIEKMKDGVKTKVATKAFKELQDKLVTIAIYSEVDVYLNKEKRTRKIQRTFSADGLTLIEIQKGETTPKTMKKLEDRLDDYFTKAWKAWKNDGGSSEGEDASNEDESSEGTSTTQEDEDLI